jgi:hypothetical protein
MAVRTEMVKIAPLFLVGVWYLGSCTRRLTGTNPARTRLRFEPDARQVEVLRSGGAVAGDLKIMGEYEYCGVFKFGED